MKQHRNCITSHSPAMGSQKADTFCLGFGSRRGQVGGHKNQLRVHLLSLSGVLPHCGLSLLFPTESSVAQTVTQPQPELSVQETETVTLACTYDTSDSNYYLFWYKQPPSGEMIFIIRQESYKQQNAKNDRFSVNFQKATKHFSLRISDSKLEDAATYFCALMKAQ